MAWEILILEKLNEPEIFKLSSRQTVELLKLFVSESTAHVAGKIVGVHRNTAAMFFTKVRRLIAEYREQMMTVALEVAVEIEDLNFGDKRRGITGMSAAGKVAVFGILKHGKNVYAQVIANCRRAELMPIIRRKASPASVVISDSWNGYITLSVVGYKHQRINHDHESVDSNGRHINDIDNVLEPSQKAFAQVQRCSQNILSFAPSRVRVALQYRGTIQTAYHTKEINAPLILFPRTGPKSKHETRHCSLKLNRNIINI